jgi:predicted small lipoprotein YifL
VTRLAPAVVVVALAALAGCGDKGGGPSGPPAHRTGGDRPPSDRTQLQALLDRRAQALLDGRPRDYAATAAGAQRARDRRAGRVAARLDLRDVRMQIRSVAVDGDRAMLRAGASWGIRGVRGTFVGERRLRAVRRPGGWRITAARDRRGIPPWEAGDYAQRRIGHFIVLAPPAVGVAAAGLAAALAAGYDAIRAALPKVALKRRYLVVVAPTARAARGLTVDIRGVAGLAAISDTAVHETGPARRVQAVVSQRLLVVWPSFTTLTEDERRRVIAHELTHAVLAGATSGRTPSWLVEGIALFVSGDRRDDQVAAALSGRAGAEGRVATQVFDLRALSAPDAIARLTGARQAGAYAYASAATYALAETFGKRAVLRLYDAFNDESLAGRPGAQLVDRALRRTVGEGLAAFEARLRAGLS